MMLKRTPLRKVSKSRQARLKWYSEKDLFRDIREERPHICEVCWVFIRWASTWCFSHWLQKWMRPQYRTEKNNIFLVCSILCHWRLDAIVAHKKYLIENAIKDGKKISVKDLLLTS